MQKGGGEGKGVNVLVGEVMWRVDGYVPCGGKGHKSSQVGSPLETSALTCRSTPRCPANC